MQFPHVLYLELQLHAVLDFSHLQTIFCQYHHVINMDCND